MDIKCATCREPWEHHHLLHDLPWEVWDGAEESSSHLLIKKFLKGSRASIPPELRDDLKDQGWVFGQTIACVLECGCCASNAGEAEHEDDIKFRKEMYLEAEAMMAGDLDGIISTLSGIDSFIGGQE